MAGETGQEQVHGRVRYHTDGYRGRVAVFPATCRRGVHQLAVTGYRAREGDGLLRLRCDACAAAGHPEGTWHLLVSGPVANLAELDDGPYRSI